MWPRPQVHVSEMSSGDESQPEPTNQQQASLVSWVLHTISKVRAALWPLCNLHCVSYGVGLGGAG